MKFQEAVILIATISGVGSLTCRCNEKLMCGRGENQCTTDGGLCLASLKRNSDGEVIHKYRCVSVKEMIPLERPMVCSNSKFYQDHYVVGCCNDTDFCNQALNLTIAPLKEMPHKKFDLIVVSGCATGIGLITALLVGSIYLCRQKKKCKNKGGVLPCWKTYTELETQSCDTSATNIQDLLSLSTGSGSGLPLLLQRTIARQIQLRERIGKGRFGEVWRGEWRGDSVAVKIFNSFDEASWVREVEIYQTSMLRHDNILGFIAADNKDNVTWTQLWLVTQYMQLGSLYDYLTTRHVSELECLDMCIQIATGLTHLHLEILGTQGKPAIAHRDLKSKNILVRHDGVCAIGDLGLAVRHSSESRCLDIPSNTRVGTKRYLAPEVLDGSLIKDNFESYKQGDIYALGLVFWEIANRIQPSRDTPEEQWPPYQPPYWDTVGIDPSIDQMRKVVCIDFCRPELPEYLESSSSEVIQSLNRMMKECWYSQPSSRLSVLRVKKTLAAVRSALSASSQ